MDQQPETLAQQPETLAQQPKTLAQQPEKETQRVSLSKKQAKPENKTGLKAVHESCMYVG